MGAKCHESERYGLKHTATDRSYHAKISVSSRAVSLAVFGLLSVMPCSGYGRLGETPDKCSARYGKAVFANVEGDYEMRSYSSNGTDIRVAFFRSSSINERINRGPQPTTKPREVDQFSSDSIASFKKMLAADYSFTNEHVEELTPLKRVGERLLLSNWASMDRILAQCRIETNANDTAVSFEGVVFTEVPGTTFAASSAFLDKSIDLENKRNGDEAVALEKKPPPRAQKRPEVTPSLNLQTSLQEGPSSVVIESLLRDFVARKPSWSVIQSNDPREREKYARAYSMELVSNEIRAAAITNEYTRSIGGETIYIYDFDLTIGMSWHTPGIAGAVPDLVQKRSFSAGIVKRGKKWYFEPALK